MFAILNATTRTKEYRTLRELVMDPLVKPYFIWSNGAGKAGFNEDHYNEAAEDYLFSGSLSYDVTLGQGGCVLYFVQEGDTMLVDEILEWNAQYLKYLESNR